MTTGRTPMVFTESLFAVLLARATDGAPYLAVRDGVPALFWRRRQAVAFRDELAPHIGRGKVVKVRCTLAAQTKGGGQ